MFRRFGLVLCGMGITLTAGAAEFHALGGRALSMGGAGVASERGAYAAYFNPALLPESRHRFELSLGAGVGLREVNLVNAADTLSDLDVDTTLDQLAEGAIEGGTLPPGLQENVQGIAGALNTLADKNGLQIMPALSLGVNAGRFGMGVFGISEATATAIIDERRLDFIVERGGEYYEFNPDTAEYTASDRDAYEARSLDYAINQGLTYLQITGLAYVEIPLAYGYSFAAGSGRFNVGGAVKIMPGAAYGLRIDIDTDSDEISEQLTEIDEVSTAFGVDLGMYYKPSAESGWSFGAVGKNLNTPTWETAAGTSLEVKPQVRAGVAYDLLGERLTLAADVDVLSNDTFIPDQQSQFLGGGISLHPASWFSLRLGAMMNLRENEDGPILTGGIGFGLKWFQLDASAQIATESGEFDGQTIPRYAHGQVALVTKWY